MSCYTCFDWFKKLRLFVNERNIRIDVDLKASGAVVIGLFSLNEPPLGLFIFISDVLLNFEKNRYIFQYHNKKSLNLFIRIGRYYLFCSFEITSIRLYTPFRNPLRGLHGVNNLIEVISSWTEKKLRTILNYLFFVNKEIAHNWTQLSLPHTMYIQWNLSNPTHQWIREMCKIVQDVGILRFYFD